MQPLEKANIDHALLAKATYKRQLELYKADMVYKNIFSYL